MFVVFNNGYYEYVCCWERYYIEFYVIDVFVFGEMYCLKDFYELVGS